MKSIQKKYDALIIGFGKGGKTLAAFMAKQGWQVAVIERSALMYGGTCINIACIPTKSLVHSAENHVPYADAIAEKNRLVESLRKRNFDMVDQFPNATVITGTASFLSPGTVSVRLADSGEEVTIAADRIIINTGAKPVLPSIPGLNASRRVFTSTTLMEETKLPERLVIIGAGYIALEFAGMYAQFGSEVTLLSRSATFLPDEDRDIADAVQSILIAKGIRIELGALVDELVPGGDTDTIVYRQAETRTEIKATAILIAAGRQPNTEDLNLEAAGVRQDSKGYIVVDERLQTSTPNIWAIGDINGGPQFTYISLDDFRIIRSQLFDFKPHSTADRIQVAGALFITPPLSHVGLREHEAIGKGYRVKVATLPASTSTRAQLLNRPEGIFKAVVDADTNLILGCTLLCSDSSELINLVQLAMHAGLDYTVLRDTIYTHPSMSESLNDLFAKIG
ncbi:Pyruvate/2-oxoglutarate dehydrogenase complex, dihydrolipoamide dehydrogenase (E3) component [Dyadobacter soli]|uniref:Pyruvate/2-oxoglutarate dehydrogenase complex, dihydrolipoamide dehydrogenase (E3) component n=1 Tax=Dyadobacter soli TaxID=659014 RepID=A0A1G7SJ69_9BACT|nr:FAD-dependent oxidoreductase [Dyadobacter soli]SDG22924.1 Pyruvate/2-oxoglutarate dehydrogenase complex, dihydrolipoamide dehydrogenase (E3) component [Dyadobacter soli]